jgi:hypothetical protein
MTSTEAGRSGMEELAGKLTEAQRAAILNARSSYSGERDRVFAAGMTRKALRERGIGHGDWCYLTPTGLALRAHLQNQGNPSTGKGVGK